MNAVKRFKEIYGRDPDVISAAPGRINIIGEHTDYNQGYVLPAAVDLRIFCLAARRNDQTVSVWAETFGERERFDLSDLSLSEARKWANYVKGVFWALQQADFSLKGMDALIHGNIPLESGLSSSAALEICVLNALRVLFHLSLSREKMALLAQKAENEFVGVECGLMDQFISVFGKIDKALFLDCETFRYEYVPLPLKENRLKIVVYNTRVRRELSSSEYNKRRTESAQALKILQAYGASSYKEVSEQMLEDNAQKMGGVLWKRARHVITENHRVQKAVQALRERDFRQMGRLLFLSHVSLRDDYEVSCPELDLLYSIGKEFPGCWGARLTGAGFGGSGIALIEEEKFIPFKERMLMEAETRQFPSPDFYEISIGEGAVIQ
ncbi:MAG: galactokinase [Candidatus Aminicenantes bacterium]|jgi:galactokinase